MRHQRILEPVIARYRSTVKRRYFRGDAAFANPEIYELLEAEGMGYAIRGITLQLRSAECPPSPAPLIAASDLYSSTAQSWRY
jgi:hypothetical protein